MKTYMHICSSCGGTMIQTNQAGIWECEYCGIKSNLLTIDNPEIIGLKKRANKLLQECDFDAAATLYSEALAINGDDAELYWLLTMCTYGIEFVEEGNKKIPTCHRTLSVPIQRDEWYQNALDCADPSTRQSYETIGMRIQAIQKKILQIANQEIPYDVFLCYKQSDEKGIRTSESSIARDLYHKLINNGYRVFFAEETLNKQHTGQEFEPYIYAALNSAPILIVIGFTKTHFESIWVKNEWHRYLILQKKKKNLRLIPYFNSKTMSCADIPAELSSFEYLDAAENSTSDLLRIVQSRIAPQQGFTIRESEVSIEGRRTNWTRTIRQLLLRRDWDATKQQCDLSLTMDPEFAWGYVGRLCSTLKVSDIDELGALKLDLEKIDDYISSLHYLDDEQSAKLKKARQSAAYNLGVALITDAENLKSKESEKEIHEQRWLHIGLNEYFQAAIFFHSMPEYKDSNYLGEKCDFNIASVAISDAMTYINQTLFDIHVRKNADWVKTEIAYKQLISNRTEKNIACFQETLEKMIFDTICQLLRIKNVDALNELLLYMQYLKPTKNMSQKIEEIKAGIYAIGIEKLTLIKNCDDEVDTKDVVKIFQLLNDYKDSNEKYKQLSCMEGRLNELLKICRTNKKNVNETKSNLKYEKENSKKNLKLFSVLLVVLFVLGLTYMFIVLSDSQAITTENILQKTLISEALIVISPILVLFGIKSSVYILFWLVILAIVVTSLILQFYVMVVADIEGLFVLLICPVVCLLFNLPGCLFVICLILIEINSWKKKESCKILDAEFNYKSVCKPTDDARAEILQLITQLEQSKE